MLKELGAKDIDAHEEYLFFTLDHAVYIIDSIGEPSFRLTNMFFLDNRYDLDEAKKVANEFNEQCLNVKFQFNDDRLVYLTCLMFARDLEMLADMLQMTAGYLHDALVNYHQRLNLTLNNIGN